MLGNVRLKNVWIKFFVDNGYKYIIFGNPTECPYGKNWGNCIISKKRPRYCGVLQMTPIKIHNKTTQLVDIGQKESRCMVSGLSPPCLKSISN